MTTRAYWALIATAAIWGFSWLCGRIIASEGVAALAAASARFVLGSFGLLAVMAVRRSWPRLTPHTGLKLLAMGVSGVFLYNLCFFNGLRTVPAGRASLIASLQPAFVLLGSLLVWRERVTPAKMAGLMLGLAGAAIVLSQGNPARLFNEGLNAGDVWLLGCAASWAAYTMIGRTLAGGMSALATTAYSTWFGTAVLLAFGLPDLANSTSWSAQAWAATAFLGIVATTLAFQLYLHGVGRIGASRASIFVNLVPVFAVLSSSLLLGESIGASAMTGGAVVILGVFLLNR